MVMTRSKHLRPSLDADPIPQDHNQSSQMASSQITPVRVLVINPNTSTHMTEALKPVVESLGYGETIQTTYYTAPGGFSSIDSPTDAMNSVVFCLDSLMPLVPHHDVFLVACYSAHPLVGILRLECARLSAEATQGSSGTGARKFVTGIMEASVLASLGPMSLGYGDFYERPVDGFGIVSTGKVWEQALAEAVAFFLGSSDPTRFVGCETTGLTAGTLHDMPPALVKELMKEATKRLLKKGEAAQVSVKAICLGCAGMVGLEDAVREACVEEMGENVAKEVRIVDGVKAGVAQLVAMARCGF